MKTLTMRLVLLMLFPMSLGLIGVPAKAQPGHWTSIGPTRITAPPYGIYGPYDAAGRLTTIAIHPDDSQIIYVGSAGQLGHEGCGVWKTTDGGQTWAPISDSLPTLSVGAIAIDPTNADRIYIVTADEGLYRSEDAGSSWLHVHGDLHIRTNTNDGDRTFLLIDPTQPNVLFLTSDDGVLRSSDGGLTWPQSLQAGKATSLVMDPLHPDVLYASILYKGIYKTTTGGAAGDESWMQQTQWPLPHDNVPGGDILLGLSHPASESSETVYALFPPIGGEVDFYSTTDGNNWTKKYTFCDECTLLHPRCTCSFLSLVANPVDSKTVQTGGPLLFVTDDGGTSFTQVPLVENDRQPASPHGDYWELTTDPTDPSVLFAGSDGGLFRSTDHGKEGT